MAFFGEVEIFNPDERAAPLPLGAPCNPLQRLGYWISASQELLQG